MKTATRTTMEGQDVPLARRVKLADMPAGFALERVQHALGQEGLAVLAVVDLRDALKRKIDHDVGPYWLVELCHPQLAARQLAVDGTAGLALGRALAVWQEGRDAIVAVLDPEAAGTPEPDTVEAHLARAVARLVG